jgi:FkbM family methyltransferase
LEGKTVLDVGAAIGTYSLLLSKLVGIQGFVYAFDPDPKAAKILRDNIRMNALSNVHVEEQCLSNVSGRTKLRANVFGIGVSSIMIRPTEGAIQEIDVKTTTIDEFCEENDIHPDGMKIDVEGAEGKVIAGAQNTIRKYSPWILLEFHGNYMDEKERNETWALFSRTAKRIVFVDGHTRLYGYGSIIDTMPEVEEFHVFAQH